MPTRPSGPLQKLRELTRLSEDTKLPTVRALAAAWGISTRSVHEAIREGVRLGWLETRRGSGIWPKGHLPNSRPLPRVSALSIAENLRQDIRSGKFTAGQPLPTPKDGSKLHGVHTATIRKAYGILQSQGMVDRQGHAWKVSLPQLKRTSRTSTVLCIGAAGASGKLRMESDREWDFWREIQLETIRCGLEPRLVALDDALPELDTHAFGAIVSNWHLADTTPLLDHLLRLRMPSAIWVANEETLPGTRYRSARTLWFHDLAQGREAGAIMARYVAGLGHRKISWISPFHGSSWSRNRLEGLKTALGGEVEVFEAVHDWMSEWDVQTHVPRRNARHRGHCGLRRRC